MVRRFKDRRQAGRELAEAMVPWASRADVIVLGLPRGGVPVAYEVARRLRAPLDVALVRKLGVPGEEELAMGAISERGVRIINRSVTQALRISPSVIDAVTEGERRELADRARLFRGNRPPPPVRGLCIVLVDDGLATGATMRAAVRSFRQLEPRELIVAVPVAPPEVLDALSPEVDHTICLLASDELQAVGLWYESFEPVSNEEVQRLLQRATPESLPLEERHLGWLS